MQKKKINTRKEVLDALMSSIRKEARTTALFVHTISEITGIHATDIRCLDILSETGSATASELSKKTGLTTGATTAMIDRLENGGFVQRISDKHDRRKVIVNVIGVPKSFTSVRTLFETNLPSILSDYSVEDLQLLTSLNEKIVSVFQDEIQRLKEK